MMRITTSPTPLLSAVTLLVCACFGIAAEQKEVFVPMFNGEPAGMKDTMDFVRC